MLRKFSDIYVKTLLGTFFASKIFLILGINTGIFRMHHHKSHFVRRKETLTRE